MTDKEYFCECIRQCENSMYKLAMGILKNEPDAEDAMQDAILKAYSNLDQLNDRSKFRPWILSIVHNCSIECIRKRKNVVDIEEEQWIAAPEPSVDTAARISIWEAVQKLKIPYRTVIILFYYEDCSIIQIAEITKTNVNSIKTQLSRGRKMLAQLLNKEDFTL